MKCDMKCAECTRPPSKCYGGDAHHTPYTDRTQRPIRNGSGDAPRGRAERVSTGRMVRGKPWEGWCTK